MVHAPGSLSVVTIHGYLVCVCTCSGNAILRLSVLYRSTPTMGVRGIWFSVEFPLHIRILPYRRHLELVTPYIRVQRS